MQNDIIYGISFADNCTLNARTQSKLQESMDLFSAACEDFGLTISTQKTAPMLLYREPTITAVGQKLAVADKFTYHGSTLSRTVSIDGEVTYRIAHADVASAGYTPVCGNEEVSACTPNSSMSTLLHAIKTWMVYCHNAKQLNSFHMSCLGISCMSNGRIAFQI